MNRRRSLEAGDGRDRTSELPTSVLSFILSLLPLRTALQCPVLSKAWLAARREFLSYATVLDFGMEFACGFSVAEYRAAVDRILTFHEAPNLDIMRIFVGGCGWPGVQIQRCMVEWIEYASSKQAREMEIDAWLDGMCRARCRFPWRAFYSGSLVCLSLQGCILTPPFDPLELPSLRELSLLGVKLMGNGGTDGTIKGLLAGYPNLANIKLVNCSFYESTALRCKDLTIKISSLPRIRSLTMEGCRNVERVEINAPTLELLHLSFYEFVVLQDVSGLKYANVTLPCEFLWKNHLQIHWALISALQRVTTLEISDGQFPNSLVTMVEEGEVVPFTFVNLKNLILYSSELMELLNFLHFFNFPSLEQLVIEYNLYPQYSLGQNDWGELLKEDLERFGNGNFVLPESVHPFASLKEVTIQQGSPCAVTMKISEFVLQRAVCLRTLTLLMEKKWWDTGIRYSATSARNRHLLQRSLETLPKASPSAKILLGCSK